MRALLAALLLAGAGIALGQTFTGSMSGSWWNPGRSGEGQLVSFERVGDRHVASVAYFTYSEHGTATWMVGNADYRPGDTSILIPVHTGSGARYGASFSTEDVRIAPAGTVVLEYVSCARMRLRYSGSESFDVDLVRLVGPLEGLDCPNPPSPRGRSDTFAGTLSGTWWNPARSGEGQVISFETAGARNVASFAYFTYDANGAPSWLVGNVDFRKTAASVSIPLHRATGARFGTAFRPADVRFTPAGNVVLDFTSCSQMRLRYVGAEAFAFDLTRLVGPLAGADCPPLTPQGATAADPELRPLLAGAGQTGNAARSRVLPSIDHPLPQLGKLLFFSKALSGRLDTACASCHHPALGGSDELSFSIGAGAVVPNVVGPGRRLASGNFSVGRNAGTFLNIGLFDRGLFWDSRVESLAGGAFDNGAGAGIRTPDTAHRVADPRAGPNLPAAQARFPVTNEREMRGGAYPGLPDAQYRDRIAARLGDYGAGKGELGTSRWIERFRAAFGEGTAEQLVTFDNIALALAEYQRSATFVDNPWSRYVRGDNSAISESAKQGALRFFRTTGQGGTQCAQCHKGDFFTDERHHVVAFPQIGGGMGDGVNGTDDFGRARQTGLESDRYRQRTPSLLNVEVTSPYGHAGSFGILEAVVHHYMAPANVIGTLLRLANWCSLPQFRPIPDCAAALPDVTRNIGAAQAALAASRAADPADSLPIIDLARVPPGEAVLIAEFLRALTDPCLHDRACIGRWIPLPEEAPDSHQLNATNALGAPL